MKKLLQVVVASLLYVTAFAQPTTLTFNYTGAVQTFTVPPCVTSVTINTKGAQGGEVTVQAPLPQGGLGATMEGDFAVTPGDVLTIIVGGRGNPDPSSSGGGGGSGVNLNTTTILIVAGGGAGVDFQDPAFTGQNAVTTNNGVDGNNNVGSGGTGGGVGGDVIYSSNNFSRGGNGWNAGNSGSTGASGASPNTTFTAGTWGLGGGGGSVGYGWCNCGGGGGGYSGGGSGQINQTGGGGGSYNVGTNQNNVAGNNTGDGVVTITYTPGAGVPPSPTVINGLSAVCAGGGSINYAIPTVPGATGYTWSVTNSTIVSGQGTTSIDIQPGTGNATISVTADNACGSSAPISFTLTVNPSPTVALGSDITQCGGTATLDAQNAGSTYMWSDMSTAQTLLVTGSGTYFVDVTDANGCGASDTINVTINTAITVSLGADDSVCSGSVLLDAQNAGSTYMWSDMSTAQTLNVTSSGTYSVTVTAANGCTATDEITLVVGTTPAVLGSAPFNMCLDDATATLSGTPAGGTWTGPGVTGNIFDPMAAGSGTHSLVYSYTDALGCTGTDTSSVFVDICLGINPVNGIEFSVSPNPNNGSFVIDFGTAQSNATVELVDVTGRAVQSNTVSGSRTTINCETQPSGVYFVRVTANGVASMEKITILK